MTRIAAVSLTFLIAAAPALAQDKAAADPAAKEAPGAPSGKLKTLLENCDAHKFETTVESVVDGKPHSSKVKMCGMEGQSDAEWIGTLKDAIEKLKANEKMRAATRDQIVKAIEAEIARLNAETARKAAAVELPAARSTAAPEPFSNDYTVLPPLPAAPPPATKVLPTTVPSANAANGASSVSSPKLVPPSSTPIASPSLPAPRLTFSCISPEFPGGGPCVTLTRDTLLTVKSGEALASGVALQFLRQGEERAEIALGSMRKGQSLRFEIPRPVCSGVVTSEVEISILRNGRAVASQGPFLLRC